MALFATLNALFGTIAQEDSGPGGVGFLWVVLVILLIICAIVWLVRR